MKKLSSKFYFNFFLIFNLIILVSSIIYLLCGNRIKLDADLFNMTPSNTSSKVFTAADKAVSGSSGKNVAILVSNKDFDKARQAAIGAYEELKDNEGFDSLVLFSDTSSFAPAMDFIYEWIPVLLDKQMQERLNDKTEREIFVQEQIESVYNPFAFVDLSRINQDPFLLGQGVLENFLQLIQDTGTNFSPKQDVLATNFEDNWYILLNGTLSEKGSGLGGGKNVIPLIYSVCQKYENDGTRFVYSGTPFHSYHSSSKASLEISIISTVSLILILIILIITFKSLKPVLISMLSIFLALFTDFSTTHIVFGNIHVMTLVFGTCLIGSCIDYSIHYFIQWKFNNALQDGNQIRSNCIKSMSFALLSTEVCFVFLLFTPFTLLKQMAFFCLTGILSSFVTTICLYPMVKLTPNRKDIYELKLVQYAEKHKIHAPLDKIIPSVLAGFSLVVLIVTFGKFGINNNISRLYQMQGRLKDDTILASKVMNFTSSSWLILSADSQEELLELDEQVASQLEKGFISVSKFVPSVKTQDESFASYSALIPELPEIESTLGMSASDIREFRAFYKNAETKRLTVDSDMPDFIKNFVNMLYIGQVDDKFYSIVLPTNLDNAKKIVQIAENNPSVLYENKVQDINTQLDKLTTMIFVFLLVAMVIIGVVLLFFYSIKNVIRILITPVIGISFICAIFALTGRKIDFFCVTGMILVFGLGLDYIIYKVTNKGSMHENIAIILSFITTVLSFGTLSLSSFVPVQTMGLSIFLGLLASFFSVIFIKE